MTRPFSISRLDHLTVLVNELEPALRFYEDVLGCTPEARLPHLAMASVLAGTSSIGLVDISVPEGSWAKPGTFGSNVEHFALEIQAQNESAVREHLRSSGVDIVEERTEDEPGERSVSLYVCDPSGNKIELLLRR